MQAASLFLSHGAPLLALEDSPAGRFLDGLGTRWPKPRGIVVASAHHTAPSTRVGASAQPTTWHDFRGFPAALYALRYPAPGAPALAEAIVTRLRAAGIDAAAEPARPLDHGVWVPLLRMYRRRTSRWCRSRSIHAATRRRTCAWVRHFARCATTT